METNQATPHDPAATVATAMHDTAPEPAAQQARRARHANLRLLLVCFAVLIAAALIGHRAGQRAGLAALDAAASHRLDVFRASFFSPVERFEYLPDLLAAHPTVVQTLLAQDQAGSRSALNALLKSANGMAGSAAAYVMNGEGWTIASSNWESHDSFVGKNFAFRPYFQEAAQGRPGRFYGVGFVTGIPGFFLASAVRHQGTIIGVVAVKADLDTLDRRWQGETDQIAVSDDSGIIFLSSNPHWKYRSTKTLSKEVLDRLRETRQYATLLKSPIAFRPDTLWRDERVVRVTDPEDGSQRRYLRLSRILPEANWTITSFSSMEQAESTALTYALFAAGGAAFTMLLAMYVRLLRGRMQEKEAARRAADHAHEQLEAKHRELEVLSRNLQSMAISDPLTGCYNRRHFTEIAGKLVSAAERHRRKVSVLILDIDFFKHINDTYGHPVGDEVLKAVAQACQTLLRQPDFLVRYGGEEFVAVLPDTEVAEAATVAERLRHAIAGLQVLPGAAQVSVTVSIGIAAYRPGEHSLEKALARADAVLYEVKRAGRNACRIHDPDYEPELAS